jgi:esterase/lipase superfamily enzyme
LNTYAAIGSDGVMLRQRGAIALCVAILIVSAGCGGPPQLMTTPNIYARGDIDPLPDVPANLQNNKAEVMYVTDRAPEPKSTPDNAEYGHKRSRSVAFGVATVEFGKDVSWDQLVAASKTQKRAVKLPIQVIGAKEICRFPPTPKTLVEIPSPLASTQQGDAPAATRPTTQSETETEEETHDAMVRARAELSARLKDCPVKDVYVFVHGVKTGFKGSTQTAAELWHFLGRQGVAVAYSWPAGGKGILRGYNYDYNSSEFTVYHLKETLRAIAGCPDVRKVHIIAHSRGTDVTVTALRELHLEIAGGGRRSTREELKLGNVVLAAPDLDMDVVIQRAATARLGKVPERSVVYICDQDEALALSRFLFGGMRFGKLQPEIFSKEELQALRTNSHLSIVDARVSKPGSFGHNYFYSNPAVSSDLILLLRYGKSPGAENGRPLEATPNGFWAIRDGYPAVAASK